MSAVFRFGKLWNQRTNSRRTPLLKCTVTVPPSTVCRAFIYCLLTNRRHRIWYFFTGWGANTSQILQVGSKYILNWWVDIKSVKKIRYLFGMPVSSLTTIVLWDPCRKILNGSDFLHINSKDWDILSGDANSDKRLYKFVPGACSICYHFCLVHFIHAIEINLIFFFRVRL